MFSLQKNQESVGKVFCPLFPLPLPTAQFLLPVPELT